MNARRWALSIGFAVLCGLSTLAAPAAPDEKQVPDRAALVRQAVADLVKIQEEGGQWPYEGVYRVNRELPVGYRVGGTSVVGTTLLFAAPDDKDARAAVDRALAFVLKELDHPLMKPSTENVYDVRVWGHGYALEFLCHLRAAKRVGDRGKDVEAWVKKLVEILLKEEIEGGGWNYANRRTQASFVTAPIVQSLLLARSQGEAVPDEVLKRARQALEDGRTREGAFAYSGKAAGRTTELPGSVARSAVCETTLTLLGGGSGEAVKAAVDAFHMHWDELEARRQKTGTHVGKYAIAPYYFYYGHRYTAQAIETMPEKARATEREKLLKVLMKTRDKDGTWNDRVFERSRNYGTAMATLVLLSDKVPLPPRWDRK